MTLEDKKAAPQRLASARTGMSASRPVTPPLDMLGALPPAQAPPPQPTEDASSALRRKFKPSVPTVRKKKTAAAAPPTPGEERKSGGGRGGRGGSRGRGGRGGGTGLGDRKHTVDAGPVAEGIFSRGLLNHAEKGGASIKTAASFRNAVGGGTSSSGGGGGGGGGGCGSVEGKRFSVQEKDVPSEEEGEEKFHLADLIERARVAEQSTDDAQGPDGGMAAMDVDGDWKPEQKPKMDANVPSFADAILRRQSFPQPVLFQVPASFLQNYRILEEKEKRAAKEQTLPTATTTAVEDAKRVLMEEEDDDDDKDLHKTLSRAAMPPPRVPAGELLLYRSGKMQMQIGDRRFDVTQGSACHFHQTLLLLDHARNLEACELRPIREKMVVVVNVNDVLSGRERKYNEENE